MIDINEEITAGFFRRWMTVGTLKTLLAQLEDDLLVEPNAVGNLSLRNTQGQYLGFIDFAEESIER